MELDLEKVKDELALDMGRSKYQDNDSFEKHDSNFPCLVFNLMKKEYEVINKKDDYPKDSEYIYRLATDTEALFLIKYNTK